MVQASHSSAFTVFALVTAPVVFQLASAQQIQVSWHDSYAVNGVCYCNSNFDHNIGNKELEICGEDIRIEDICAMIGEGPEEGREFYNDIQCGNGPPNDHDILDEIWCPGRVDFGPGNDEGCNLKGPLFDLGPCDGDDDAAEYEIYDEQEDEIYDGDDDDSEDTGMGTAPIPNSPTPTPSEGCVQYYPGEDIPGNDGDTLDYTDDDDHCIEECQSSSWCNAATRNQKNGKCWLKAVDIETTEPESRAGYNSWIISCASSDSTGLIYEEE